MLCIDVKFKRKKPAILKFNFRKRLRCAVLNKNGVGRKKNTVLKKLKFNSWQIGMQREYEEDALNKKM